MTAEARADAERQRAPLLAAELARVTAEAAAAAERQRPPLLADALSRVGREVREAAIGRCEKVANREIVCVDGPGALEPSSLTQRKTLPRKISGPSSKGLSHRF